MPKRVCFYVGLPKTGTTTIQQYLRKQDDNLRSVGFLYPGPREHPVLDAHYNHPVMFNAMMGKMKTPVAGLDLEGCRDVVAQALGKFHQSELTDLVWSYEAMALSVHNWDADYLTGILAGAEARIVFFVRYTDDWIESLVKQNVWARAGPRAEKLYVRPLRPIVASAPAEKGVVARAARSTLAVGVKIIEALEIMRAILPSAEIVVRSYDENRAAGTVVSGALAAMGIPLETFPGADEDAGVRNATKSEAYSMLLYHLEIAKAGMDVVRDISSATQKRDKKGLEFEPLKGRRFRFLSDDNVYEARAYYERLREDYPDLPPQPPYVSRPAERSLPRDEGLALLEWLRPDISDATFDKACAFYPPI